jgi:hypothetical protein
MRNITRASRVVMGSKLRTRDGNESGLDRMEQKSARDSTSEVYLNSTMITSVGVIRNLHRTHRVSCHPRGFYSIYTFKTII